MDSDEYLVNSFSIEEEVLAMECLKLRKKNIDLTSRLKKKDGEIRSLRESLEMKYVEIKSLTERLDKKVVETRSLTESLEKKNLEVVKLKKCNDLVFDKFSKGGNAYVRIFRELEKVKMELQNSKKKNIVAYKKPIIKRKKPYICHFCGLEGHIRPYCYDWLEFCSKRRLHTEKIKKQKECQVWRPIMR